MVVSGCGSPLVDRTEPIRGKPGRPRLRAETMVADRGYDHNKPPRAVIARRQAGHRAPRGRGRLRLGKLCWVVGRIFAVAPAAALGAPARTARGVDAPRLRVHLPALPAQRRHTGV
jgi:hypothetical protein